MGRRCRHRLLLVSAAVLILLLSVSGEAGADELTLPGYVVFWSPRGPVAVDRETDITASELGIAWAEELVAALLQGPTPEEAQLGLHTAIPQGTRLAEVLEAPDGAVIIRLEMPLDVLPDLDHDSFEIIVNQLATTLHPLDWRDLQIKVRGHDGTFLPLADFLPEVVVPRKEPVPGLPTPLALEIQQAPLPGQGQPTGALSGKTVYVSAGHGWWWRHDRWRTQRPPYPNHPSYPGPIIEDHKNAEAVNQYLIQYLWNAGAAVRPTRERGMNPDEVMVVNDALAPGTGYYETGQWVTTSETGTGYKGTSYRWTETVSGPPTATATWRAELPAEGRYPVYVWYRPGKNRPEQAQYVVHHAGGDTTVFLDQRIHGNTWHYLGTYGFLADQEAVVTLTNQSNDPGKAVIADSVRFGGGTFDNLNGIASGAGHPPNKPWWEVGSFYYTQKMGMPPADNDITARPAYARWEHWGTGDDAVFVSWHSNGWTGWNETIRGTETYAHNGLGKPRTEGSLELRNAIHSQLIHDIRVGWDPHWVDRGAKVANYGELRELWEPYPDSSQYPMMPGALIEIAFHDHPQDADALKDPQFNMLAARAVYKGIVGYFEQRDDAALPLLPEPPTGLRVQNVGDGAVHVAWEPSPTDSQGLLGDPPTGYRVYTSPNGIGWSDGKLVTGATSVTLSGLPAGELIFVRVTAVNAGGESFATETLAARVGDPAPVLIVNGFTRLDNTALVGDHDPVEGYNERMLLDQMNRYDYVIQHAEVIPYPLDSVGNGAVKDGLINLDGYQLVVWILGQESYRDRAMSKSEQALLRQHLDGGGALFTSGSEIAWTLDNLGDADDRDFFRQHLRAAFVGNGTDTWQVAPVSGSIFDGLGSFRFDTPGMYLPKHPDQIGVSAGSTEALRYEGGRGGTAAIQYADGCERVVTFGFPFETIGRESRALVMERVLDFLGVCLYLPPQATITTPTDGSAHNQVPAFEGSAQDYGRGLERVEVQVQRMTDSLYWTGSNWDSPESWEPAEGTENWSYSIPGLHLMHDGFYVLRARARAADGAISPNGAEVEIIIDTQPPPTPGGLIEPDEGDTLEALRVDLHWETVEQDDGSKIGYQVEVNGHIHPAPDSPHAVWLRGSGPHEWRVRAVDQAGNESDWTRKAIFYLDQSHLVDMWLPIILREFDR